MRKLFLCLAFLVASSALHAQGIPYAVTPPAPNAMISVCTAPATGNPCTNNIPVYGDAAMTQLLSQPINLGTTGNFMFFYAPTSAPIDVQISGRPDQIIAGGGGTLSSPGPIGATNPSSGAFTTVSASGQITSTVASGTAPFVIASNTNVANLNASSLSGATFPAPGAIGGTTPGAATFAGLAISIVTKTSTYPATAADDVILCNGTFTITLPITAIPTGKVYRIKNIGTGQCLVSAGGSVNIDNATTFNIPSQYETKEFIWDSSQYWVF